MSAPTLQIRRAVEDGLSRCLSCGRRPSWQVDASEPGGGVRSFKLCGTCAFAYRASRKTRALVERRMAARMAGAGEEGE